LCIANDGKRYCFNASPDGELTWQDDPGDQGTLLAATFSMLASSGRLPDQLPAVSVELCSRNFYASAAGQQPLKLGIGSSAALAVALVAALQATFGQQADFAQCLDAHRLFQGGKGSGVDVATSWQGGVISMYPDAPGGPELASLEWPAGLCLQPVWTGESASTVAFLKRLDAFARQSGKSRRQLLQALAGSAQQAVDCWSSGDSAAIVSALDIYGELLARLDSHADLGIWSDRHNALRSLAVEYGVGYKPSGAGGGDFGISYATDPTRVCDYGRAVHKTIAPQSAVPGWTTAGIICGVVEGVGGQADV
jgi:phosphomevalonate kinase